MHLRCTATGAMKVAMEHARLPSRASIQRALVLAAILVPAVACDVADEPRDAERIGLPCPNVVMPAPGFCPDGDIVPRTNELGCIVGYDCVVAHCPALDPVDAPACGARTLVAEADEDGCMVGFECVDGPVDALTQVPDASEAACPPFGCNPCPQLVPPGPGFCPGGTIVPVIDDHMCIVSYACT